MLKIEVIKFEAQDVITASVATVDCLCGNGCDTTNMDTRLAGARIPEISTAPQPIILNARVMNNDSAA